jgi:hypothetical protein
MASSSRCLECLVASIVPRRGHAAYAAIRLSKVRKKLYVIAKLRRRPRASAKTRHEAVTTG